MTPPDHSGFSPVQFLISANLLKGDPDVARDIIVRYPSSLAFSNSTVVAIGSRRENIKRGKVRIFRLVEQNWIQLGDNINGEAQNDRFGISVALSSDGMVAAIGAFLNGGVAQRSDTLGFTTWLAATRLSLEAISTEKPHMIEQVRR